MKEFIRAVNWRFIGEVATDVASTLALWLVIMVVAITGLKLLYPTINLLRNWLM